MPPPTLRELLKEPFGPYPDYAILDSSYKPQGKKLPQLERLRLRQDNQFIGFDSCERYLIPPDKEPSTVFFLGVLVIQKLEWLSPAGKDLLTKELNIRDSKLSVRRSSQNSRKSTQLRELSLESLYGHTPGEGFRIKVWIRCEKDKSAMYMTVTDYPESLLVKSREQHRTYEITTIDRPIYDRSRNFLERYRLVALIDQIMKNPTYFQDDMEFDSKKMEVDHFVAAYLMQHKQNGLSHAAIFSSEDDPPPGKPFLRHISRAEIRAIFAAHSGWLLAFYLLARKKNPLEVRSWCDFMHKVRIAKAASASGSWGETYEDEEIWDSDTGEDLASIAKTLAKFGGTPARWEKTLKKAITRTSSESSESSDDESYVVAASTRRQLNYDSDFSELSTPGCSDSEYDSDTVPSFFPFPRILLHMSQPPVLRPGRFKWDCPILGCTHSIDFLKLVPTDYKGVNIEPEPTVYLGNHQYKTLRDENVQTALRQMVSRHYCQQHLGMDSAALTPEKQKLFIAELSKKWGEKIVEP
ncbi:hypothetical protein B0H15DRAFT_366086 [Mycena belliarum]|uniref:Uncharacterized protein n=1 Tax=Mycena belliarum TaxID=1033014 RepID=A0AAD6XQM3_9AGAR|nr:hypothetical protein B0H15DRAFT_366086 [Mycena belliae]